MGVWGGVKGEGERGGGLEGEEREGRGRETGEWGLGRG